MSQRFYIVDDDAAVRRMLEAIIHKGGLGEVVGEAENGKDALRFFTSCQADVVLVDLLLPDIDGIELVRNLRAQCGVACVMISQVQAKEMIGEAYEAGIEFFINKPLNAKEVQAVLSKVGETVRLRLTVNSIYRSVSELAGAPSVSPAVEHKKVRQKVRAALHDMGIGGEAGARDLEEAAVFLVRNQVGDAVSMKELVVLLAGGNLATQKAAEQRMRRAVLAALRNLAALGLEDYGNPRFESYAATFFDFSEVRREMKKLHGDKKQGGKISLKCFLAALAHHVLSSP